MHLMVTATLIAALTSPVLAKKRTAERAWLSTSKNSCIARVVTDYGVTADKVKLGKNRDDAKGLLNIRGKVDKGDQGVKAFMCKFNVDGALIDVMSMTSDGRL